MVRDPREVYEVLNIVDTARYMKSINMKTGIHSIQSIML
jgi:hypothetical protein